MVTTGQGVNQWVVMPKKWREIGWGLEDGVACRDESKIRKGCKTKRMIAHRNTKNLFTDTSA